MPAPLLRIVLVDGLEFQRSTQSVPESFEERHPQEAHAAPAQVEPFHHADQYVLFGVATDFDVGSDQGDRCDTSDAPDPNGGRFRFHPKPRPSGTHFRDDGNVGSGVDDHWHGTTIHPNRDVTSRTRGATGGGG